MTYSVSIPNLDALQRQFQRAPAITTREVTKAVNQSLIVLQGSAKQKAPIDQGRLRQGIIIRPAQSRGNTVEGAVAATTNYSLYQEQGTGIYGPAHTPIRPKRSKVLVFQVGGKTVFAKQVKGVRPRYFMRGAIEDNQGRIDGFFRDAAERITREVAA